MKYEVRALFHNEKDAKAFLETVRGLSDRLEFRSIERIINRSPQLNTRLGKLMFSLFNDGRSHTLEDAEALAQEHGYKAKSAYNALYCLTNEKLLTWLGSGTWEKTREIKT